MDVQFRKKDFRVEVSPRYTNDHAAEGLSLKTLKFVLFFRYSYIIHTSLQFVFADTGTQRSRYYNTSSIRGLTALRWLYISRSSTSCQRSTFCDHFLRLWQAVPVSFKSTDYMQTKNLLISSNLLRPTNTTMIPKH